MYVTPKSDWDLEGIKIKGLERANNMPWHGAVS
jgi:hypothetical protein